MRFQNSDWETVLTRIKDGTCTPFLGAAVNYGMLPLGAEIATRWADVFNYPLGTKTDLAKVAQFIAIATDNVKPKELIRDQLNADLKPFNFSDNHQPVNILAKLPLPVYITTNYDDLLFRAIEHHGLASNRRPVFEICKWNSSLNFKPNHLKRGSRFRPSPQTPIIYHLHGHLSVLDSLVLTEDDYLDFLVNMSKDFNKFLPARIQEAVTGSSLLFVGYSLADIDFRVLFRGLLGNLEAALGRMSVAVQLPYEDGNPYKSKAEDYVTEYFHKLGVKAPVKVYWGTAQKFTEELWDQWCRFNG